MNILTKTLRLPTRRVVSQRCLISLTTKRSIQIDSNKPETSQLSDESSENSTSTPTSEMEETYTQPDELKSFWDKINFPVNTEDTIDTQKAPAETSDGKDVIDFHKLSNFIKEAYKHAEEPLPSTKEEQVDYFEALFSKRDSSLYRSRTTTKEVGKLDKGLSAELRTKCTEALTPTLEFMSALKSSEKLYMFMSELFEEFSKKLPGTSHKKLPDPVDREPHHENIYLHKLFQGKEKWVWTERHDVVIKKIQDHSTLNPNAPLCNVLTLPIIFNHSLKLFTYKFSNVNIPLSMINLLQANANLFAISTNQQTFNEVLRMIWIFYGNINLHQVYNAYRSMKFLGFPGDIQTFNILKVVIMECDRMKNGKSVFNKHGDLIFTPDDNLRMEYFRKEYYRLKDRLEKQS